MFIERRRKYVNICEELVSVCLSRSDFDSWLDVAVFPTAHATWREYHSGPKMEPEKVGQNMMGRSSL